MSALPTLPELPCEVISLILSSLNDPSKCAAACLARAWRDAAASPHLWKTVGVFPGTALRLTDAGLASLVRRSAGGLTHLRLPSASSITREGLAAAMTPRQEKLKAVLAYGNSISGADIAAALATYRGRLRKLKVCGIRAVAVRPDVPLEEVEEEIAFAFWASCNDAIGALLALLAPEGKLDAIAVCDQDADTDTLVCARLCTIEHKCENCETACCKKHAVNVITECVRCGGFYCDECTEGEVCYPCLEEEEEEDEDVGLHAGLQPL